MVTDTAIKKGYRKTDVGVIPSDWEIKKLNLISDVRDGTHESPKYFKEGVSFITSKNIVGGRLDFSDVTYISKEDAENIDRRSKVDKGDILMSMIGTIGNCVLIDFEPDFCIKNVALIKPETVEASFLIQLLYSQYYQGYIKGKLEGGIQKFVSLGVLRELDVPLPPTKTEQTAIAAVLSDADALIISLEKLITKKRNIKQGAMQELLMPKEGWVIKKLGEIFTFSGGYSASREQLSNDGFCYLHYGDIHGAKKTFINVKNEYTKIPKLKILLKNVPPKSLLSDGDIVFVDASEDDEGTSRHIVVKNTDGIPYISGLHTIVAKSKDNSLDNDFKRYCFQTKVVKSQFKFYAVGTKVSGINKTNIAKIEIAIPSKAEQTRIATILTDMDTEIEVLKQKLAKYRMIKQGMMQELLTGKTRLI